MASGHEEYLGEGIGIFLATFYYEGQLKGVTNLQERMKIADIYAATLQGYGGLTSDAYKYEQSTRPTTLRDPSTLKPTQETHGTHMTDANGNKGQELADQLKAGKDPASIEPVRVSVDENGDLRTLDHRRVETAKLAGTQVNTIELTLEEAKALPGAAGVRAAKGRFDEIKPRTKPLPRKPRVR